MSKTFVLGKGKCCLSSYLIGEQSYMVAFGDSSVNGDCVQIWQLLHQCATDLGK